VAGAPKSYLTFRVARKDLAIEAACVQAILPLRDLISVPGARPGVLGVVRIAGRMANVVDAVTRLQLPPWRRGKQPWIVVLGTDGNYAAFIADRVCDVVRYANRDLNNGVLRGEGRNRTLVQFDQIVREKDFTEIWAVIP
jgi:chemotaxis signal transduction protein